MNREQIKEEIFRIIKSESDLYEGVDTLDEVIEKIVQYLESIGFTQVISADDTDEALANKMEQVELLDDGWDEEK